MAIKRNRLRAGGFIISEEGSLSRDGGYLAEGENLDAGTLLEENDDGDLIAWTASDNSVVGILFDGTDARAGRVQVALVARFAVVSLDSLTYPEDMAGPARDALAELRIVALSDHAIADTGGGGGGDYVAKAVHFDGSTWLESADALGAVPGPRGMFSVWCLQETQGDLAAEFNGLFIDTPSAEFEVTCSGGQGPESLYTGVGALLQKDTSFSNLLNLDTADNVVPVATWANVIMAWDTDHAQGLKKSACYINRVLVPWDQVLQDVGAAFDTNYAVAKYIIGTYANNGNPAAPAILGDIAEMYFNSVDTIIEADNTISVASLNKFVTVGLKPVDLGADGSTPTGSAPTMFLSGDADSFALNAAGTGAFTVHGGPLTNATTSPSD